jgi:uncharacterized Tic20 family protein
MAQDLDTNKILSALAHGSIFFNSLVVAVGIPIAILLISNDSTVKENAKEALNFHLNMWLYYIIAGILVFVLIGWILLPILGIFNLVMPIIAIAKIVGSGNSIYRYPFIFRVF